MHINRPERKLPAARKCWSTVQQASPMLTSTRQVPYRTPAAHPPTGCLTTPNPTRSAPATEVSERRRFRNQEAVRSTSTWVQPLREQMARVPIVGHEQLVDRLIFWLKSPMATSACARGARPGENARAQDARFGIGLHFRASNSPGHASTDNRSRHHVYNPARHFSTKHGAMFANLILGRTKSSRPCQGAERIARSHAGAPGHARRRHLYRFCPDPLPSCREQNPLGRKEPYPLPNHGQSLLMKCWSLSKPPEDPPCPFLDAMGRDRSPR